MEGINAASDRVPFEVELRVGKNCGRETKCIVKRIGVRRELAEVCAVKLGGDLVEQGGAYVVGATEGRCPDDAAGESVDECAGRFGG